MMVVVIGIMMYIDRLSVYDIPKGKLVHVSGGGAEEEGTRGLGKRG